jgi:hypothetical protein
MYTHAYIHRTMKKSTCLRGKQWGWLGKEKEVDEE